MNSTIGHRLFGLGRVPKRRRENLLAEGVRVLVEGIRVSLTYRDFRSPGRWFAWRRSVGSGAVVLTHRRLFVSFYRWPILDVEFSDPRLRSIGITEPAPNVLQLTFDVGDLDPNCSGEVTIRLRTAEAAATHALCEI